MTFSKPFSEDRKNSSASFLKDGGVRNSATAVTQKMRVSLKRWALSGFPGGAAIDAQSAAFQIR